MFVNSFELVHSLKSFGAIILVGLVIKIMDDFLDQEWPPTRGLLAVLGKGILPYSLVILILAISLDASLAISLFLASYVVGMLFVQNHLLPSGFSSWLESGLALLFSTLIVGYKLTLWAVLIMLAVQLIDDYFDFREDHQRGVPNLRARFGQGEAFGAFLLCLYLATLIRPLTSVLVLVFSWIIGEGINWSRMNAQSGTVESVKEGRPWE